jgi:hypothetical protein
LLFCEIVAKDDNENDFDFVPFAMTGANVFFRVRLRFEIDVDRVPDLLNV